METNNTKLFEDPIFTINDADYLEFCADKNSQIVVRVEFQSTGLTVDFSNILKQRLSGFVFYR